MSLALGLYQQKVMERICATCVDRNADGSCGLDPALECEVQKHLPELLTLVKGVTSDRIADYVQRLRHNVCRVCNQAAADGTCELRARLDCTLDRYFVLVVEAIEDLEQRTAADALATAP
jgi:hypothetical protein